MTSPAPSTDVLRLPPHTGHMLIGGLERNRNKPVLSLGDSVMTGGDLLAEISRYVQALESLGAGEGTSSGLLALNRPEVLVLVGTSQVRGLQRTPLHPMGSLDDHAYAIADAGITTLIIDPIPMFVDRAVDLLDKVECLTQILTLGPVPDELTGRGADLVAEAAKYDAQTLVAADLAPDYVGGLAYTGGTTGKPKGVMGTAGAVATMTAIQLAEWEWPDEPQFLMCTPLSHAGAAFFVPIIVKGGCLHVMTNFDPPEVLRTIEERRINSTMLVPAMLYMLMDHPDSHTRDLSSLETVYYGASAINPVRLQEALDRFGPIFAQYYGQSEAPMVVSYLPKGDHDAKRLTSCGRPTVLARTALLGEDGLPVATGEIGEICVGGPLLAGGYWNRDEETAEAFRDGWLHTGDMARADDDGFWFIVDRSKDMIVTGGFNVFPREVEDIVAEHPAVAQVAVVGAPDDKWGEAVTAVVVLRPDANLDQYGKERATQDIRAAVKARKGSVHTPKQVIFVDAIPMTMLGKPDKKTIRASFWQDSERSV